MVIREGYITDTCLPEFKDLDGSKLSMYFHIDEDLEGDDLCYGDKGMREILDEEDENSGSILEECRYDLMKVRLL